MIIFSDVDGTLLNSKRELLPSTLKAIGQLNEKGIPFVIVTGRIYSGVVNPILKPFQLKLPVISCNGAIAYDEKGKKLFIDGFSVLETKNIIASMDGKFDVAYDAFGEVHWIPSSKLDPRVICEEELVQTKADDLSFDDIPQDEIILKLLFIGEPSEIERLKQHMKKLYPDYEITNSHPATLEIMKHGINKGNGIRKFCSYYGKSLEKTICFGDNYNDIEMLETVSEPILMGNAPTDLKKRFIHHTEDNNHDGIYLALKEKGIVL